MHLLIFGHGYSGAAIAALARARGIRVTETSRAPSGDLLRFGAALPGDVTHAVSTVAPDDAGDPVLRIYGAALAGLRWVGYLSTTGVYGDQGGNWVDEATPPAPGNARSQRRRAAEREWEALSPAVDLFRVAGIYGPGRSAFDDLRGGTARRVVRPGHAFGRIHVADIAGAVLAAAMRPATGARVLHLADDLPAESADVMAEAAALLGVPAPPAIPFAEATMSPMARSFWAENRKVASQLTQAMLDFRWRYPSYREGLRAVLAVT